MVCQAENPPECGFRTTSVAGAASLQVVGEGCARRLSVGKRGCFSWRGKKTTTRCSSPARHGWWVPHPFTLLVKGARGGFQLGSVGVFFAPAKKTTTRGCFLGRVLIASEAE